MTPSHLPLVAVLGIGALVAWCVYRRVRRFIGRQRFRPVRSWLTIVFFPLLVIGLLAASLGHPERALAELAGVGVGIGLAMYGLRHTKFEVTPIGLFYTPSIHIGIVLSLLLVGRVAYRIAQVYLSTSGFGEPPGNFVRSPVTLMIFGTLAGYYAWYAFGIVRWQRSVPKAGTATIETP